jgi:hypothetical protein
MLAAKLAQSRLRKLLTVATWDKMLVDPTNYLKPIVFDTQHVAWENDRKKDVMAQLCKRPGCGDIHLDCGGEVERCCHVKRSGSCLPDVLRINFGDADTRYQFQASPFFAADRFLRGLALPAVQPEPT